MNSVASQFDTPSDVIAVYEKPEDSIDNDRVARGLNIVLDNIQDPGNLGTIIRLADWFGIHDIFASRTTVDVYNHKVVQVTMGAIARVKVHYGDLVDLFEQFPDLPVYGTFLDGKDIYTSDLGKTGFVIFGNEGQGISAKVAKHVNHRLLIPKAKTAGSESLNVGVAAGVPQVAGQVSRLWRMEHLYRGTQGTQVIASSLCWGRGGSPPIAGTCQNFRDSCRGSAAHQFAQW